MKNGLRLVIEVRSGFVPEAVLDELYRLTPMEETFGINNVALVDGQPKVLGLRELLQIYVDFRIDVVRRRCEFRRAKREARLHLVDGLVIALLNIDEVIQVIRTSDDAAAAKERLMQIFDLSDIQAQYILDTPLRRLTRYDRLELERERETLRAEIAELTAILESPSSACASWFARSWPPSARSSPRRAARCCWRAPARPGRRPCRSRSRTSPARCCCPRPACWPAPRPGRRRVRRARFRLTIRTGNGVDPRLPVVRPARGPRRHRVLGRLDGARHHRRRDLAARLIRLGVLELPALPPSAHSPALSGGAPISEFVTTGPGETVVAIVAADAMGAGLALGTAQGVVKRVTPDYPQNAADFDVITLKERRPGRRRGAAGRRRSGADVHHQRRPAAAVPGIVGAAAGPGRWRDGGYPAGAASLGDLVRRGRPGRWRAGRGLRGASIRAGRGHGGRRRWRAARHVGGDREGHAVRRVPAEGAGHRRRPLSPVPQGRGRPRPCLGRARPARGATEAGTPVDLPPPVGRRDGSGERVAHPLAAIGGAAT